GDRNAARRAWQTAAEAPRNRFDTAGRARERLRDLGYDGEKEPPESQVEELEKRLASGDYSAAERVARWRALASSGKLFPRNLALRAEELLRARGGAALADRVFGPSAPDAVAVPIVLLRSLRDAIAAVMAGDDETARLPAPLQISGLRVRSEDGHEVLRLGAEPPTRSGSSWTRVLSAGTARYELSLWPSPPSDRAEAVALLVETLFYRRSAPSPPVEFAE